MVSCMYIKKLTGDDATFELIFQTTGGDTNVQRFIGPLRGVACMQLHRCSLHAATQV
jgi:hypothetical protein